MYKKTFNAWEKACKDEWKRLTETGDKNKSDGLAHFNNYCPACHIAAKAQKHSQQDCRLCPIDKWRKIAEWKEDFEIGQAMCELDGELYNEWAYNYKRSRNERKLLAAQIANLKWSWLPEYKYIEV